MGKLGICIRKLPHSLWILSGFCILANCASPQVCIDAVVSRSVVHIAVGMLVHMYITLVMHDECRHTPHCTYLIGLREAPS